MTVSPTEPVVGETVFFNGIGSTASSGREIVLYEWDFGDESFAGAGVTQEHIYQTEGTSVVILRVRDRVGQTGTTPNNVMVGP